MITQWIRVIHEDDTTLTDLTLAAQNSDTMALPLVSAEDYVYIGQHFPFNNWFTDINTANSNAATWSIDVWDGSAWQAAVDILDETTVGGVPWSRSGVLQFSPDRDEGWVRTLDTSDSDGPTGLTGLKLYNLYWMRVKPSANLSAGTILNTFGYRFANTQMLDGIDPELSNYLTSWESGKTDWDEQLQLGSEHVISDMKSRGMVVHPGQILRIDEVGLATAYKTLIDIIYPVLGPDFDSRKEDYQKAYNKLMSIKRFTIDQNLDGQEDAREVSNTPQGVMVR